MTLLMDTDKADCSKEQEVLVEIVISILQGNSISTTVGTLLTVLHDVIDTVPPELGEEIVLDIGDFAVQTSKIVVERRDAVKH